MKCPDCQGESRVIDTRTNATGSTVKRRRQCLVCGKRFTTYENAGEMPLVVRKKDGHRELFDPSKIMKGLEKACQKRPVSLERMEAMTAAIERELKNQYKEVPSSQIGQAIMHALLDEDEVAYVRFASVYKDFNDLETFLQEIKRVQEERHGKA